MLFDNFRKRNKVYKEVPDKQCLELILPEQASICYLICLYHVTETSVQKRVIWKLPLPCQLNATMIEQKIKNKNINTLVLTKNKGWIEMLKSKYLHKAQNYWYPKQLCQSTIVTNPACQILMFIKLLGVIVEKSQAEEKHKV